MPDHELVADAVTSHVEETPEQSDNRPREEDGPQFPEELATSSAPLPDEE